MAADQRRMQRSAGILLHPTSLPGPFGIGDLGPPAFAWIDALARARQTWWQVLPLGPTGYGDSPYQAFSAFAGNPYLISPVFLIHDELLTQDEVERIRRERLGRRHLFQDALAEFKVELGLGELCLAGPL